MDNQCLIAQPNAAPSMVQGYLNDVAKLLPLLPVEQIASLANLIDQTRIKGSKVILCGNGGSSATASHWANDLSKGASGPARPRVRALALTDCTPLVTALANDTHYDWIFAEQITTWAEHGDVVIAISGSGNSANVLRAVECARQKGAATVGLIGFGGGKLAELVDLALVVASYSMEQVEDAHMIMTHAITALLRQRAAVAPEVASPAANGQRQAIVSDLKTEELLVVNER